VLLLLQCLLETGSLYLRFLLLLYELLYFILFIASFSNGISGLASVFILSGLVVGEVESFGFGFEFNGRDIVGVHFIVVCLGLGFLLNVDG
jgi:hypothetical protein